MKNMDLGYDYNNIIRIEFTDSTMNRINYFKNILKKSPKISATAIHDYPINNAHNWTRIRYDGAQSGDYTGINVNYVDHNFTDTYNMKLIEGEGFIKAQSGTTPEGNLVMLNETAVRKFGMENPIGKKIYYGTDYRGRLEGKQATIVGVLKDFNYLSARNSIKPIMLRLYNEEQVGTSISVKFIKANKNEILKLLESNFTEIFPGQVFKYHFVDEYQNIMYSEERKLSNISAYLAILAILIASLGVFGLVSYSTAQRTKEIGIRKTFGAEVFNINWIFTRDFIGLIILAFIISIPIAYLWIDNWLDSFPYKVEFAIWPFLFALLLMIAVTQMTIAIKTLTVARINPTSCLTHDN